MVVKIKLQRKGTKNRPFYRVVVQADTTARDGAVIEFLGQYDPLKDPAFFKVDPEKTKEWLSKGAQPTDKVRILLGKAGIMEPVDLAALPKRKSKSAEEAAPETAPTAAPAAPAAEKKEEPKAEENKKEAEK